MSYVFGLFLEVDEAKESFRSANASAEAISSSFQYFSGNTKIFHSLSGIYQQLMGDDVPIEDFKFPPRGAPNNPSVQLFRSLILRVVENEKVKHRCIEKKFIDNLIETSNRNCYFIEGLLNPITKARGSSCDYAIDPNYEAVGWLNANEFGEALEFSGFSKKSLDSSTPAFSAYWDYVDALADRYGADSVRVVFAGMAGS